MSARSARRWQQKRRGLTLSVTASNTPTLKSLLPYANNVPSSETSNAVTGFCETVLVFFKVHVLVSHSETNDFFSPGPGLRERTAGEALTMV